MPQRHMNMRELKQVAEERERGREGEEEGPNLQVQLFKPCTCPTHLHRKAIFISRQDKCHNRIKRLTAVAAVAIAAASRSAFENDKKVTISFYLNCFFLSGIQIVLSNEALH